MKLFVPFLLVDTVFRFDLRMLLREQPFDHSIFAFLVALAGPVSSF